MGAWRLPWHRETRAFVSGGSTSKTKADGGAANASVKGGSRQPHLQGSGSRCHSQLGAASKVLPGAPGQAEPVGNTPGLCNESIVLSGDGKARLSRRQSFLRLVWQQNMVFLSVCSPILDA